MSRALFLKLFAAPALVGLFLIAVSSAMAQANSSLAGEWKMVSSTGDGNEVPWTLTIQYKDGNYSATVSTGQGEAEPKNFKVDGDDISMGVDYQGEEYEIKLKHSGEKLIGTWSGNGDNGDTKGERASASQ